MDEKKKLLIIDDEENMLHMLEALLSRSGYMISTTTSGAEAVEMIEKNDFDFMLCDVRMPEMDGLQLLSHVHKIGKDPTIIMMSAYGNIDMAISAMKAGAYDFISKPFKKDEVLLALKKAEERENLRQENKHLRAEIEKTQGKQSFSRMVYQSKPMEDAVVLAKKAAKFNTTVLITGGSGTGKELLAQGIHEHSERKERQFFAVNCGSIPEALLESELFGHIKGAFTGADRNKKGIFEEADGSTLFLDEIGEMPLEMQVKLLRVLQEGEIRPVGSNISRKVDVRIIAATARDLFEKVQEKTFREDLYYRLNVIHVQLPKLVDRRDDIPLLCHHFMEKYNGSLNRNIVNIQPHAMELMYQHSWPGNVRELENIIQRGIVLAENSEIEKKHLPEQLLQQSETEGDDIFSGIESLKTGQRILEKQFIQKALKKTRGNKSTAAKLLELSYPSLLSKIKEYEL